MIWIRLAVIITVFIGSCFGLGYLAGLSVRRLKWGVLFSSLMSVAIALVWPAIAVWHAINSARVYQFEHPGELNDAPGMVLMSVISVGVPLLFIFSLPLALFGSAFACQRYSRQTDCITTQGASE
jgi:hypothetical protein